MRRTPRNTFKLVRPRRKPPQVGRSGWSRVAPVPGVEADRMTTAMKVLSAVWAGGAPVFLSGWERADSRPPPPPPCRHASGRLRSDCSLTGADYARSSPGPLLLSYRPTGPAGFTARRLSPRPRSASKLRKRLLYLMNLFKHGLPTVNNPNGR